MEGGKKRLEGTHGFEPWTYRTALPLSYIPTRMLTGLLTLRHSEQVCMRVTSLCKFLWPHSDIYYSEQCDLACIEVFVV